MIQYTLIAEDGKSLTRWVPEFLYQMWQDDLEGLAAQYSDFPKYSFSAVTVEEPPVGMPWHPYIVLYKPKG